ncbi:MAG: hypothetical protein J6A28_04915 [Clostridia bacterium]|nr:hypothetical protein [Clostridia bacterium]
MKKFKNIIKYLALTFTFLGIIGGSFLIGENANEGSKIASAAFSSHTEISNNLPDYVAVDGLHGKDVKDIFLLNSSSSTLELSIAEEKEIKNIDDTDKLNPAYYTQEIPDGQINPKEYYYFDFSSSLSLYKDLTNQQYLAGEKGENLLKYPEGVNHITQYTTPGNFSIENGYFFTPQSLHISFGLNTLQTDISFDGDKVLLNEEGIYTLIIPTIIYYTNNSGTTFTSIELDICYTFMVFNSSTYFKSEGIQNVDFSANLQGSTVTSLENYSMYYFYNYAYSTADANSVNTLPTLIYNNKHFKINIKHTDVDDDITNYYIEYQNGEILTLNSDGQALAGKLPIHAGSTTNANQTKITFIDLGEYEINFDYLYIVDKDGATTSYSLPLNENLTDNTFKNKSQKVYVYGYQAMLSDYSNLNPATNQPVDKEIKTFTINESTSKYNKSADITSAVNQYVNNLNSDADTTNNIAIVGIDSVNPSSSTQYDLETLEQAAGDYIQTEVEPVSTNQPPIKFISNATLAENGEEDEQIYSKVYTVGEDKSLTALETFDGFNQNTAGTYCYIIQYRYDNYMSTSGTLQAGNYHYQIFYFTIENKVPSVSIYEADTDENDFFVDFKELYTRGFTNKSVFILNNAKNNDFDATVSITLSAYNYNTNTYYFQNVPLNGLTGVDQNLVYQVYHANFDNNKNTYDESLSQAQQDAGVDTKYGVLIRNTAAYANARFTVTISSAVTTQPSIQTFTIDTQSISNVNAFNAEKTNSSYFILSDAVAASGITNRPIAMSWKEKNSGAATYGYLKHIPFSAKELPTSSTSLGQFLREEVNLLPVAHQIDFSSTSTWAEYTNSQTYSSNIPATNVRTENGIYILQIYDEAGNYTFKIFMIDKTAPIFVKKTQGDFVNYQLIQNSSSISVPDEYTSVSIMWAKHKGIYVGPSLSFEKESDYQGYTYSGIECSFKDTLDSFLNGKTKYVESVVSSSGDFVGHYFLSKIEDVAYVKDRATTYQAQASSTHSFEINFFNTVNGELRAHEGTCKIILRDASNGYTFTDQQYAYINYPSSYLSFNITSDTSNFTIYEKIGNQQKNLEGEAFSQVADLYLNGSSLTTTKTDTPTDFEIKYSYLPSIKTSNPLYISYVPCISDEINLDFVNVKYYPYETVYKKDETTGTYYYYKDIITIDENGKDNYQISADLFKNTGNGKYKQGEEEHKLLAFGSTDTPLAGKYVITRQYIYNNGQQELDPTTLSNAYDYLIRQFTFYVDNNGIISSLENIKNEEGDNGLESVVGGDIVLNMHSGKGSSAVSISFPNYNSVGLNAGSFFSQSSFTDSSTVSVSLDTNKLPLSLYIPKYKYTISSIKNEENGFDLSINDNLSYFGNVVVKQNGATYDVVIESTPESEGILVTLGSGFSSREEAYAFMYGEPGNTAPLSISGYELSAQITWIDPTNQNNKKYYSTKPIPNTAHYETQDDYLIFYTCPNGFGNGYGEILQNQQFTDVGKYEVTLFQNANDKQSNIYSIYKFAFEITSAKPDFDIVNVETGYKLERATTEGASEIYYTNADKLRIQWEDPTDPYMAKVNRAKIAINGEYISAGGLGIDYNYTIEDISETSHFFELYPSEGCVNAFKEEGLEITFEFENHGNYYQKAIKKIYFDIEAPTANLEALMDMTASSSELFTKDLQKSQMRQYVDYLGVTFNPVSDRDEKGNERKASYIYNVDSGVFRNYSFTVDKTFFQNIKDSFYNSSEGQVINGSLLSEIYYRQIDDIHTYNQSNKSTFLSSFYTLHDTNIDSYFTGHNLGRYYEIVETDWAGNKTIYVVFLIDESNQEANPALIYTDNKTAAGTLEIVTDAQLNADSNYNIYANTGFKLAKINYNNDAWIYFKAYVNGQVSHFFASPWLETAGQVYEIVNNGGILEYKTVNLDVETLISESSQRKHSILLSNRTLGISKTCYITVMDASLVVEKITENVANDTVSISINIPTGEQINSVDTGYIYPVKIKTEKFVAGTWEMFAEYEQQEYGTWTATDASDANHNPLMTFSGQSSSIINKLIVSVKAGENERVKFTITDNFGNILTTISLTGGAIDEEIISDGVKYFVLEDISGKTYISTKAITYNYNTLLYDVEFNFAADSSFGIQHIQTPAGSNNIASLKIMPQPLAIYYDGYYTINVYSASDEVGARTPIKTFYIRLINLLPEVVTEGRSSENGIVFLDKNQNNLGENNIKTNAYYLSVEKDGKTYSASATTATTYSRNVTIAFPNGLKYANLKTYHFNKGITYSAYLSKDGGITWENIDNTDINQPATYTIAGVGKYLILIEYNEKDILTSSFKLFEVTILDSASSYYYITVNGQHVEKSTDIKYSLNNTEYEITYLVSLQYADRQSLEIHLNEELGVAKEKKYTIYLGNDPLEGEVYPDVPYGTIVTEIYSYWCDEAKGDFVIIYIPQSSNIAGTITYELANGDSKSLKDGLDQLIVADKDKDPNFNKLKISYSSHYGVTQNQIQPVVYKVLNGEPVRLNSISYKANNDISYIYLEMSGTYYLQILDSCTPANSQVFNGRRYNGYEYVEITFLSSAPFEVITTNDEGEEIVTAPIQKAVYNQEVKLRLTNTATYYLPSAELTIDATKNGKIITVPVANNVYTFSDPGFYTVKFNATSSTGVLIRSEEYSFTILNKNESRYAFEFSEYGNYYIETVKLNGVDVTKDLITLGNFKTTIIGGEPYLSSITLNHLDQKTGKGRYEITVNINNPAYQPVTGERFTFALWINLAQPPIRVSLDEGGATTDPIQVTFNPQTLYKAVGDCYVQIGNARYDYTSENIATFESTEMLTISASGTYFIQVYTQSGQLLYSYKVTKNEPLNSFAILAIILGALALGAVVFITIKLRKRQKVK